MQQYEKASFIFYLLFLSRNPINQAPIVLKEILF